MSTKKLLISGVVGGIVAFFGGWLIYGILLMKFFSENIGSATGVMRADTAMIWWALILGNISAGLLMSYIFNKWANINTLKEGLLGGATIGLFMTASYDLINYATTNISNLNAAAVDIIAGVAMGAITGAVVGWANGWSKKTTV